MVDWPGLAPQVLHNLNPQETKAYYTKHRPVQVFAWPTDTQVAHSIETTLLT